MLAGNLSNESFSRMSNSAVKPINLLMGLTVAPQKSNNHQEDD